MPAVKLISSTGIGSFLNLDNTSNWASLYFVFAKLKDTRLDFLNERKDILVDYGITRKMNPHNFPDVYFGGIAALVRDVKNAPELKINSCTSLCRPVGDIPVGIKH